MSPPPSPRQSVQISASSTSTPSRPTSRYNRDNVYIFATTWITGVLAAAASILFGVWAPLSYKAAADGNRDNDAMLSSMLSSVSVANSIAYAALNSAGAQARLLEHAESRLGAMGQLALYQFCATQTAARPCQTFLASDPLTSLISYLATPVSAAPRPAKNTDFMTATGLPLAPEHSSGPSSLSIAAILGIVFGLTGAGGLVLGVLIWQYRKKRAAQDGRNESED